MTSSQSNHGLTGVLALLGAAITVLCWSVWGPERGMAAGAGALLSVVNWVSLRWVVGKILVADMASKAGFSLLLMFKMGALMGVLFILMHQVQLEPLGLILGLGVLFVGPVLGGLLMGNGTGRASNAGLAGEEQ